MIQILFRQWMIWDARRWRDEIWIIVKSPNGQLEWCITRTILCPANDTWRIAWLGVYQIFSEKLKKKGNCTQIHFFLKRLLRYMEYWRSSIFLDDEDVWSFTWLTSQIHIVLFHIYQYPHQNSEYSNYVPHEEIRKLDQLKFLLVLPLKFWTLEILKRSLMYWLVVKIIYIQSGTDLGY